MLPGLFANMGGIAGITPGSVTYRAGTFGFLVPEYNVLTFKLWGGGATGQGRTSGGVTTIGNDGGDSTIAALSLFAGGGKKNLNGNGGGPGAVATASGGDINDPGGQGGRGQQAGTYPWTDGSGGSAGGPSYGGGGRTAATPSPYPASGLPGLDVGGGSSGERNSASIWGAGGGGGAFCMKTFARGAAGAPMPGTTVTLVVGDGGAQSSGVTFSPKAAMGAIIAEWR